MDRTSATFVVLCTDDLLGMWCRGAAAADGATVSAAARALHGVVRPVAKRVEQPVAHHRIEVALAQRSHQRDRRAHLLEVRAAAVAAAQVRLDALPVGPREASLEVIGDELDELLAADGVDGH